MLLRMREGGKLTGSVFTVPKVGYAGERVKRNLVEVRTASDFVSWFQVFRV